MECHLGAAAGPHGAARLLVEDRARTRLRPSVEPSPRLERRARREVSLDDGIACFVGYRAIESVISWAVLLQ
ncbi:hypothetical protein GCM10011322_34850 [Salinarimonas ramus]|uniref:Uncharacterized protein n=1 Tax=Salinarimonas ramus TaxID=690164 RepID=A0A917QD42_9HYPH|nr:hypothetical protein GCM10011322_34850 [Salinarimonas ramus]